MFPSDARQDIEIVTKKAKNIRISLERTGLMGYQHAIAYKHWRVFNSFCDHIQAGNNAQATRRVERSKPMGAFSIWHWLVVLGIVVIIFGPSRLPSLGHDLGKAIKDFKHSIQEKDVTAEQTDIDKKNT